MLILWILNRLFGISFAIAIWFAAVYLWPVSFALALTLTILNSMYSLAVVVQLFES